MEKNFNINGSVKTTSLDESREMYALHLADNALILGQRNSEWCGHGPVLEQDIALTNISLDLIGQARHFYQYAAALINARRQTDNSHDSPVLLRYAHRSDEEVTEDTLAYLRTEREFKNCLLTEQPNGDWGQTILRQFFFSNYQYLLYQQLQKIEGPLAAIAEKSLKEVTYHVRWSSEWVIRLGDGTEQSRKRMLDALNELWRYTGEFFIPADYELQAGIDVSTLKEPWEKKVKEVMTEATLPLPEKTFMQTGGKQGQHTEHLGYILAELQYMQRAYPGCEW